MDTAVTADTVAIVRTPTGVGVGWFNPTPPPVDLILKVEVDYEGHRLKEEWLRGPDLPWRDYFSGVDMMRVNVRVKDGERVLAELDDPWAGPLPFMVLQGEQRHITESYVSVPPALTITDPKGDVWTLGFQTAPPERSPYGEYAFEVLRNGVGTGTIASRVEIRSGKVRAFTRHGWQVWVDGGFFF